MKYVFLQKYRIHERENNITERSGLELHWLRRCVQVLTVHYVQLNTFTFITMSFFSTMNTGMCAWLLIIKHSFFKRDMCCSVFRILVLRVRYIELVWWEAFRDLIKSALNFFYITFLVGINFPKWHNKFRRMLVRIFQFQPVCGLNYICVMSSLPWDSQSARRRSRLFRIRTHIWKKKISFKDLVLAPLYDLSIFFITALISEDTKSNNWIWHLLQVFFCHWNCTTLTPPRIR